MAFVPNSVPSQCCGWIVDRALFSILCHRYKSGSRLSADHENTIREKLLRYHPESVKKIGCGIDYITVFHYATAIFNLFLTPIICILHLVGICGVPLWTVYEAFCFMVLIGWVSSWIRKLKMFVYCSQRWQVGGLLILEVRQGFDKKKLSSTCWYFYLKTL